MTGIAPSVAIHIPWDTPEDGDYVAMRQYAEERGVHIGAVNPNVFQDEALSLIHIYTGALLATQYAGRQKCRGRGGRRLRLSATSAHYQPAT